MSPFEKWWSKLRARRVPFAVRNWNAHSGYIGDQFRVVGTSDTTLTINGPHAVIPKDDFEAVFAIWPEYVQGRVPRYQIRDELTRHSKYIISILHYIPPEATAEQT